MSTVYRIAFRPAGTDLPFVPVADRGIYRTEAKARSVVGFRLALDEAMARCSEQYPLREFRIESAVPEWGAVGG